MNSMSSKMSKGSSKGQPSKGGQLAVKQQIN